MTRRFFIERTLRQIYGGQPSDDATIGVNLVNAWLNDGIAIAAKANYKDNITIDGTGYVNNSFYATFKGLTVIQDESFVWKVTLPQLPIGVGANEGVSILKFKDFRNEVSLPCIPLTQNQATYFETTRAIPNKVLYKTEGGVIYAYSTILLSRYTASVTMISGGDSTDLDSTINIPDDYLPVIVDYIQKQLMLERNTPVDTTNDGEDVINNV